MAPNWPPGFSKTNAATWTKATSDLVFAQMGKEISIGLIPVYLGLDSTEKNTVARAIKNGILNSADLKPPGDPLQKSQFRWARSSKVIDARFALQSALLNGGTTPNVQELLQRRINDPNPPAWYSQDHVFRSNDDKQFTGTLIQQWFRLVLADLRKEGTKEWKDEAALASSSRVQDEAQSDLRLRRGKSKTRIHTTSSTRAGSSSRRSRSRGYASSTGLTDAADNMELDDYADHDVEKKPLSDLRIQFVWIDEADVTTQEVSMTASTAKKVSAFFSSPDLSKLDEIEMFRVSLHRCCPLQPRPALETLTAAVYQRHVQSFDRFDLSALTDDAMDTKIKKVEYASLLDQAHFDAFNFVEVIQIFVTADPTLFDKIPNIEASKCRDIVACRVVSNIPPPTEPNTPLPDTPAKKSEKRKFPAFSDPGEGSSAPSLTPKPKKARKFFIIAPSTASSDVGTPATLDRPTELDDLPPPDEDETPEDFLSAAALAREQAEVVERQKREREVAAAQAIADANTDRDALNAAEPYPFWVSKHPDTTASVLPSEPSVDVGKDEMVRCNWLTSGYPPETAVEDMPDNEQLYSLEDMHTLYHNYEHRSPNLWEAACKFWGGDETDLSPSSGVFFKGWNRSNFLRAYQMYSTSWILQQHLLGRPAVFLAHDMGLGKTAVVVAAVQASFKLIVGDVVGDNDRGDYFNPQVLMDAAPEPPPPSQKPRLTRGPVLLVAEHKLSMTWVENIRKFVGHRTQIVLAGPQSAWSSPAQREVFISQLGCYSMFSIIEEGSRWYPPADLLRERYTAKGLDIPSPFRVTDLLRQNLIANPQYDPVGPSEIETDAEREAREAQPEWVSVGPPTWFNGCSNWMVFTTNSCLDKNILLEDRELWNSRTNVAEKRLDDGTTTWKVEDPIDTCFRLVIVDEFHEHVGKFKPLWASLGSLPGTPQFIYISGTPFNKFPSLVGPVFASEAQYWEIKEKSSFHHGNVSLAQWVCKLLSNKKTTSQVLRQELKLNGWGRSQSEAVRKELTQQGWAVVDDLADKVTKEWSKINAALNKDMKKTGGEPTDRDRIDASKLNTESRNVIGSLGKLLAAKTIKFGTDYRWLPNAETCSSEEGMLAAPMPPHGAFDIHLGIPEEEMSFMMPAWHAAIKTAASKASKNEFSLYNFTKACHEMRVLTTLPCLLRLQSQDKALKRELKRGLVDDTAEALLQNSEETRLWRYMAEIDKMPAIQCLRRLLCQIRGQRNFTDKFPRKVVVTAFLPFTIAVVNMWLRWVLKKKAAGATVGTSFTAFSAYETDVVFVNSHTKEKIDTINTFKGIDNADYQDKPGCLLAAASQIGSGMDLVPADCIIMIDSDWITQTIEQTSCRVRRAKMTQKALKTEVYRMMCYTKKIRLQLWMDKRNLSRNTIRAELAKCGIDDADVPVELIDLTKDDDDDIAI
jgi:hypothetical protein